MRKWVKKLVVLLPLVPLAVLSAAWEWIGRSSERAFFLYGTPTAILSVLFTELGSGEFWADVAFTASHVIVGFVVGNVLGTVIGLLLWRVRMFGSIAEPYVIGLSSVPVFALVPLFILWFGIGYLGKVSVVVFSTIFVSISYAFHGAREVEKKFLELNESLRGSRKTFSWRIVFPGALIRTVGAYRLNVGLSLVGGYVAEWVSSERGLGQYILRATSLYDVPRVFVGLSVFVGIALLMTGSVAVIERRTERWRG